MTDLVEFTLKLQFEDKSYKSLLRKIQTFARYTATVGIHATEGAKKVIRRYFRRSNNKNGFKSRRAGRGSQMNIAKLAYQNEFGANILIRPRYRDASSTTRKTFHSMKQRITVTTTKKYSALRNANEQGYLLCNKLGKFVAYFRPNSVIHIPKRPFITKILKDKSQLLKARGMTENILSKIFVKGGVSPTNGIKSIAHIVEEQMKINVLKAKPANHELTKKAKGFNSPLRDEQNRLLKSIKYKVYKDGNGVDRQLVSRMDTLIGSGWQQYINKGVFSVSSTTKAFTYKGLNPNFMN